MIKQLASFLVLYTSDLQKTIHFYEKFGIEIQEQDERKCVFHLGTTEIHFNTSEDIPEYKCVTQGNHGAGTLLYVEVENVEEAYTIVKCIGGHIKAEIEERPWNTKEFLFQDPNGYNIVFYEEQ